MTTAAERDAFNRIVDEVLDALPAPVRARLGPIPVLVEDEPPAWALSEMGIEARRGEADLCGLHTGGELDDSGQPAPQQIYLFRGPIFRLCETEDDLREEVRITLLHEIAHHFGYSDADLESIGYD